MLPGLDRIAGPLEFSMHSLKFAALRHPSLLAFDRDLLGNRQTGERAL